MDTDGGGWTVFQKRMNGAVDFYLNWTDYVHGFGNISGEYWLGLDNIHHLTNGSVSTILLVNMSDKNGNTAHASYSTFYIGGSTTDYRLHLSGYNGTAGDSLAMDHSGYIPNSNHNLMKFSTKDKDNDQDSRNCAAQYNGGWWYNKCYYSNLNGRYGNDSGVGIVWFTWKGWYYSLPFVEMKLRHT